MISFCLLSLIHMRILGSAADLPDSMLLDQELHENPFHSLHAIHKRICAHRNIPP